MENLNNIGFWLIVLVVAILLVIGFMKFYNK